MSGRMASPETKNQKYVLSDKKLCYCQGTAQRAMFHEVWELKSFQTAKVTLKIIQRYWQWCHSIGHIEFLLVFCCNYVSILHH